MRPGSRRSHTQETVGGLATVRLDKIPAQTARGGFASLAAEMLNRSRMQVTRGEPENGFELKARSDESANRIARG